MYRPLPASLADAWRAVVARPLPAIGGFAAITVVIVGGCLVPWLNFPFVLLGLAPAFGGYPILSLALVDGRARFRDAFGGFRRFERFLGIFWVGYLVLIFLSWPLLAALWVDRHLTPPEASAWVLGTAAAVTLGLQIAVLAPYVLVLHLAADAPPGTRVGDLLERSARLTAGHRARLASRALALLLIAVSGAALLGAGLLFTVPLAWCAAADQYRAFAPRPPSAQADQRGGDRGP